MTVSILICVGKLDFYCCKVFMLLLYLKYSHKVEVENIHTFQNVLPLRCSIRWPSPIFEYRFVLLSYSVHSAGCNIAET